MDDIWFRWDFKDFSGADLAVAFFTFLYVDLLDTTGTLYAMAEFAGLLDSNGDFPGQMQAFVVDGAATSFGAFMGVSPVTTYIESAPGIEVGGRTVEMRTVARAQRGLAFFAVEVCSGCGPASPPGPKRSA